MRTWPYVVLLAEILLFFRRVIFQPSAYVIPWDFQYYAFNQESFFASSLRAGHFPLWDPFTYCGMALYTNIQSQVFYPPTLLTVLLANLTGSDRLMHLLTLELAAHILFAGIATMWLLEAMGCDRPAALLGATALQLGCYFASQTQHFGAITGAAWMPLSFLAVVKLASPRRWRWAAILAVSLAMPVLAGYPSTISAAFLCSLILVLALAACRVATPKAILYYAAGALGGIGLSAIQLLPTIQIATMSVSKYRGDWRGWGSGIRFEALPSLIWPNWHHILDLRGYHLTYNFTFLYLYCGVVTLALAIFACFGRRTPYAIPFLGFTIVAALMMFGDATPAGAVLLPYFFTLVRDSVYPEFMMAGFSLGMAVLAGFGAQRLAGKPMLLTALLCVTVLELSCAGSGRPMNTRALKDEPGITSRQFDGSVELLETVRKFVNQTNPPARLETYGDAMGWTSMAPTIELPTGNGNDPFALVRYMNLRRIFCGGERWGRYYEVSNLNSPILDLLNVRFIIARKPWAASGKYRLVASPSGHYLYENLSVLPRFFLVRKIVHAAGMEQAVELLRSAEFDPAHVAVVEGAASEEFPEGQAKVRVLNYARNGLALESEAAQSRFLVTSEAEYPGWRAYIDGVETPVVLTNAAFRGLRIPPGRHRIEFQFRPEVLGWSAGLSALTLMAVCFALIRTL